MTPTTATHSRSRSQLSFARAFVAASTVRPFLDDLLRTARERRRWSHRETGSPPDAREAA